MRHGHVIVFLGLAIQVLAFLFQDPLGFWVGVAVTVSGGGILFTRSTKGRDR